MRRNLRSTSPIHAAGFVLLGMICQDYGASISVKIFPEVGALGMVLLRVMFSAVVLVLLARPRIRRFTKRDWLIVLVFGLTLTGMNATFYEAIARIPLGITVTLEVLGPLTLALILNRRPLNVLWAVLAMTGVVLLGGTNIDKLDALGLVFALIAAVCWALYILASAAAGRQFDNMDGLAMAMVVGTVLLLPLGTFSAGTALLNPTWLAIGFLVALLSSTIPYALELQALRRLPESAFGVLTSLSPAVASIVGLISLGQAIAPLDWVAIGLVILASAGAVLGVRQIESPPTSSSKPSTTT